MVKVHTVEMIEHSANSNPYIVAHKDMINGEMVGVDFATKKTVAPTVDNLYIILNTQVGDNEYALTYPIPEGDFVNCFKMANWVGKELDVTAENVNGTLTANGTAILDTATGKFKSGTATTGKICFKVAEVLPMGYRLLIQLG